MEGIVAAFAKEEDCRRAASVLEGGGLGRCICCRTAGEVKRLMSVRASGVVVCGYSLPDATGEALCGDLPPTGFVLLMASPRQLALCRSPALFHLPIPCSRTRLLESASRLLAASRRLSSASGPAQVEQVLLQAAKERLMADRRWTEEQAHRHLQKTSMDAGLPLPAVARRVLDGRLGAETKRPACDRRPAGAFCRAPPGSGTR